MITSLIRFSLLAAFAGTAIAKDAPPKIINFAKEQDVNVSITLLKSDGKVGRNTMIMNGYRPQTKFSAEPGEVTCALKFPKSLEAIEPGQTADIVINCVNAFKVEEGKLEFSMMEGGRRVATGVIKQ
jgi:translation elongation factor EF-Tu-like GTPase